MWWHMLFLEYIPCLMFWTLNTRSFKEIYKDDHDFSLIFQECSKGGHKDFFIHDSFLFRGKRLCVPQGSLRQSLVRKAHEGGLMGHFRVAKTLDTLHEHFF